MKIKHLLAAVSVVALATSSAHALDLANTGTDFQNPLATQLDLAASPVAGTAAGTLTLTSAGDFPAGDVLTVVVTMPAGVTFSAPVSGTDLNASGASGSVIAGGTTADSTVTFNIGVPTSPTITPALNFNLGVAVASCDNLSDGITVTANLSSGAPVEGDVDGATDSTFFAGGCANALVGALTSDEGTSDTTIDLTSGYTQLSEAGGILPVNTPTPVGTIQYEIQDGSPVTEQNVAVDAIGTNLAAGDITAVTYTVTTGDTSGTVSITSSAGIVTQTSPTTFDVVLTGAQATGGVTVFAEADGSAPINTQSIVVSDAQVSYDQTVGAPEFILGEAGVNGALDTLQREGQTFGVFDWNGGEAGRTISQFRITGLVPNSTTDFNVTISNSVSSGGMDVDGNYEGTVVANENGVATLSSAGYNDAGVPDHKNHDSLITIETPNDLDMDRLIARNGIVTNYGDGANSGANSSNPTPTTDGDQVNPVTGNSNE